MKKIFLVLFMAVMLCGIAAAQWNFDNVKEIASENTIIIKNSILGIPTSDAAKLTRNTPQTVYVTAGKDRKIAEVEIEVYEDYDGALNEVKLYDMTKSQVEFPESKTFKYKLRTQIGENRVPITRVECTGVGIDEKNQSPSDCKEVVVDYDITPIYEWIETDGKNLKTGKNVIGLYTDVEMGERGDWVPTDWFGVRIDIWANWAEGGTITRDGDYVIHTFYTNSSFNVTSSSLNNVSILIVAGGGGGGGAGAGGGNGAGGGGGGVYYNASYPVAVGLYNITVGSGGSGGALGGGAGSGGFRGGNSTFGNKTTNLSAYGGGGGGTGGGSSGAGLVGGSGGGGGSSAGAGGAGTTGQGNAGGKCNTTVCESPHYFSAGGGGAGTAGVGPDAAALVRAGAGGNGTAININGSNSYFGGGGGGGSYDSDGMGGYGGIGGGGRGSDSDGSPNLENGTDTLGGGGGGGGYQTAAPMRGGRGGDGVVIIRYYQPLETFRVNLNSPAGGLQTNSIFITFNCSSIDPYSGVLNLTLTLGGVDNFTVVGGAGQNLSLQKTVQFADNTESTWNCRASNGTATTNSTPRSFTIHNTPPNILITYPTSRILYQRFGENLSLNYNITEIYFGSCWYSLSPKNKSAQSVFDALSYSGSFADPNNAIDFNWNTYTTMDPGASLQYLYYNISDINYSITGGVNCRPPLGIGDVDPVNFSCWIGTGWWQFLRTDSCEIFNITLNTSCALNPLRLKAEINPNLDYGNLLYELQVTKNLTTVPLTNCALNTTSFNPGNYSTIILFSNDTFGNINSSSVTWTPDILEFSRIFQPTVNELSTDYIAINFEWNNILYYGVTANLIYNGTAYSTIQSGTGKNLVMYRNHLIPSASKNTNYSFYWTFSMINSTGTYLVNTSISNQTVNKVNLDNCSQYTTLLINFTMWDELSPTYWNISAINSSIETTILLYPFGSTTYFINYSKRFENKSTAQVCIDTASITNTSFRLYETTKYYADGYVQKYHYIQNYNATNSTLPIIINLYELPSSLATSFLMTYKDNTLLPVGDALISINRQYVSEGLFRSVEIVKTDDQGQATGWFDLNGPRYTLSVYKEGVLLSTFDNTAIYCEDKLTGNCRLNLYASTSGASPTDYATHSGTSYTISAIDETTRESVFTFTELDGSAHLFTLNGSILDNYGDTSICSSNVFTSSGSLTCNVPTSTGNKSILIVAYKDGFPLGQKIVSVKVSPQAIWGGMLIFIMVGLAITFPMMLIPSAVGVIIGVIVGVGLNFILLTTTSIWIGGGAAIIWLIVAGAIILWKINKGGGQ